MNAEDSTANCWKKAITIIRRILVVSVLKTTTSRYNISSGSCLLRTKIKQDLPLFIVSGLTRFIASAINQAGSPYVIPGCKLSRHTETARLTGSARLIESGPKCVNFSCLLCEYVYPSVLLNHQAIGLRQSVNS